MRFRVTWLLLCVLITTGVASAQSLGSAARKERQRREKNKEQGVAVHEYSETQIFGDDEDDDEDAAADDESGDESGDDASASERPSSPLGKRIDVDIDGDAKQATDEQSRNRQVEEAEWRNRFQEARERVALAREQKQILDGVHHVEGMQLVDENGNVIVETLDDLRRLVAEASQELTDAETALKSLEEEARRAGVPPGWRR